MMKLKSSFDAGIEKLKWLAALLGERLKVEVAVVKLLTRSRELEKSRDDLLRSMGERVFELRGRVEADVLGDSKVKKALGELEKLDAEIEGLKGKVSEIGKAEG